MLILLRTIPEFREESPLLLNMAAEAKAGGGVRSGAGAQEEQLFRSSNYYQVYADTGEYWQQSTAIYTPKVTFFRGAAGAPAEIGGPKEKGGDGKQVGYPFLPENEVMTCPCIAVAGI